AGLAVYNTGQDSRAAEFESVGAIAAEQVQRTVGGNLEGVCGGAALQGFKAGEGGEFSGGAVNDAVGAVQFPGGGGVRAGKGVVNDAFGAVLFAGGGGGWAGKGVGACAADEDVNALKDAELNAVRSCVAVAGRDAGEGDGNGGGVGRKVKGVISGFAEDVADE